MYVVVAGGGNVGYNLVKYLLSEGHEALLVEKDKAVAETLRKELGETVVEGDASKPRVLRDAGAARANVLVAATGQDAENLVICQVAKMVFKCPRTISRVNDPRHEDLFLTLGGSDATVSATRLIDSMLEEQVQADAMVIPLLTLRGGGMEIIEVELSPTSPTVNAPLHALLLPSTARVICLIRANEAVIPVADTVLYAKDKLIILVKKAQEQEVRDGL